MHQSSLLLYFDIVIYTIEFKKRDLSHAHILVFLKDKTISMDPSIIDKFISAKIPDKELDPVAYAVVENYMIHGPCGEANKNSACMEDNRCTKHFPKAFNSETMVDEECFYIYKRCNDDRHVKKEKMSLTTCMLFHITRIYWLNIRHI
jgi:hypothetical protein